MISCVFWVGYSPLVEKWGMRMPKKHFINPNVAKLVSSSIIAVIMMAIVMVVTDSSIKKINNKTRSEYLTNSKNILDSYSKTLTMQIETYRTALHAFNVPQVFSVSNDEQIFDFLKRYQEKLHPDFLNIYFTNLNGYSYFSDGKTYNLSSSNHYKSIINLKLPFKVSQSLIKTPVSNRTVFIISEPVYDIDNNIKGVLSASVRISSMRALFEDFHIGDKGQIAVVDKNNNSLLSILNYKDDSFIQDKTLVLTDEIELTPWKIILTIRDFKKTEEYKYQQKHKLMIFFIAIICILFLITLETFLLSFFQKRQLLATLYDPLTNLWTRENFENECEKMLRYFPKSKFMLIECDVKGFKFVNQNYTETKADEMIIYLSGIFSKVASKYKGFLCRNFADHFTLFMKIKSVHSAMNLFKEEISRINEEVKSFDIPIQLKYGITFQLGKTHAKTTIHNMINQATFAKASIKDNMIVQYSLYNSKLLGKINEERFIETHMEQALENEEFFVLYQPKIDLTTDKAVGAEALVRWYNSEHGLMSPDKFIPLFERNGFIQKLDFYVYDKVFHFIQNCLKNNHSVVPISLNMSRYHNKPDKFMHEFMALFNKYTIPPSLIEVEILERSVLDSSSLKEIVDRLHNEGFKVAMDDFGSGESSLNMLSKIPVDILKFDRDFLLSSTNETGSIDAQSADFIETLVDLGRRLKKRTIFEGVETQQQIDFLKSINCDQVQGFFYSKPLAETDFISYINLG